MLLCPVKNMYHAAVSYENIDTVVLLSCESCVKEIFGLKYD